MRLLWLWLLVLLLLLQQPSLVESDDADDDGGSVGDKAAAAANKVGDRAKAIAGQAAAKAKELAAKAAAKAKEAWNKFVAKLKWLWKNYKWETVGGAVGAFVLFIILICICCKCCCKGKKKKKKEEKLKLKGAKPSKKLKRIQPGKRERRVMEEVGNLKATLQYDLTSNILLVKVIEGEDIPVRDLSGYAYSYVICKITPLHDEVTEDYKSTLVRAGFWPQYAHSFSFVIEPEVINKQDLYLYVYELNRWSKKDGIGQLVLDLKDYNLKTGLEVELNKKLKPYDPLIGLEVESGAVKLGFQYDMETWELECTIQCADIVPADEDKEKCGAYVTLTLLNSEGERMEKQKTEQKKGSLTPEFDKTIKFTIPENLLPEVRIYFAIKTKCLMKRNKLLGQTTIVPTSDHWKQLVERGDTEGWFSVFRKPSRD